MCAAVVLGFLLVGLSVLQTGNREGILRIRARDAANLVAQHVLDSISAAGLKSFPAADTIYKNENYVYHFEGKPQLDKKTPNSGIKISTVYSVTAVVHSADSTIQKTADSSHFTKAQNYGNEANSPLHGYAKSVEVSVSWQFKESTQSIQMARVVK